MPVLDSEYLLKKAYWESSATEIETKEVKNYSSSVGKTNYTLQIVYLKKTIKLCGRGSRQ